MAMTMAAGPAARWWGVLLLVPTVAGTLLVAGCGRSAGGPTPPPPVPNPPIGTPPVVTAIAIPVARVEVDQDVTVTATVQDDTPVTALTYVWSASAGTISGAGPSVTWRLPKGAGTTPADVTISLTVVEPYQAVENGALVNREHRVTRQASAFRVHDSEAEISRMVRTFLIDYFGNINVSPDACLVDFSDTGRCAKGKADERDDIVDIRANYEAITQVLVDIRRVTFNGDRTFADVFAPCVFRSTRKDGTKEAYSGNCELTAVYENNRWWLCESRFNDAVALPTQSGVQAVPQGARTFPSYFR
jgi:hypothetical protein